MKIATICLLFLEALHAQVTPTLMLTSSQTSVSLGSAVTLTADITPVIAGGAIAYWDGVHYLGAAVLNANGRAVLTASMQRPGSRKIRAYHAGNSVSRSNTVTITVRAQPATAFETVPVSNLFSPPLGMAAGDFNADGRTDLVTTGLTLLNRGGGLYDRVTDLGSVEGVGVAVDANMDGKLDIAWRTNVTRQQSGYGDGRFQPPQTYSALVSPVVDFNGDGLPDSQLPLLCPPNQCAPSRFAVGDFNGDGWADIVYPNVLAELSMNLGSANGFSVPVYSMPIVGSAVMFVADVNNDGMDDLISSEGGAPLTFVVLLGHASGVLVRSATIPQDLRDHPSTLVSGDFDGDGMLDFGYVYQGGLRLLFGAGNGTFPRQATHALPSSQPDLIAGEFDGDGRTDLAALTLDREKPQLNAVHFLYGRTVAATVTPAEVTVSAAAGSGTFNLAVDPPGASWMASVSGASWLRLPRPAGTGNGAIDFYYEAWNGTAPRVGKIAVFDKTFQITQLPPIPSATLSPASVTVGPGESTGAIGVILSSYNTTWSPVSNAPWIVMDTDPTVPISGSSIVWYRVERNPTTSQRTGTITIVDKTYTITQTAEPCPVLLTQTSPHPVYAGGGGTLAVTIPPECPWTVTSDVSWISFPGGAGGIGPGTIAYTVASNASTTSRSGALRVGVASIKLRQRGWTKIGFADIYGSTWQLDLNGDGVTDWTVPRQGGSGFTPIPGDWNGDGRTKIGDAFHTTDLNWRLDANGNGLLDSGEADFNLGWPGDTPLVGDWNGDGKSKVGIFRAGMWLLDANANRGWSGPTLDRLYWIGQAGDIPVVGDWNGDFRSKVGFFRNGMWLLDYNGNGAWEGPAVDRLYWLGQAGDIPLTGDWNGDGKAEIGFFRAGMWLLDMNGNGAWEGPVIDRVTWFGQTGDVPLVGDWNGDGRSKIGICRRGTAPANMWLLDFNGNGGWDGAPHLDKLYFAGSPTDLPVTGMW